MRKIICLALCALTITAGAQTPVSHRVIAQDKGHVAIIDENGALIWEIPCAHNSHDISVLPNGNLLLNTAPNQVTEVTPDKKVVWQYTAQPKPPYNGSVEVHAFQRLKNGLTMVAETGNLRIVELDRNYHVVHEIPITVDHEIPHRDTRLVRKLDNGHYLACHEGDGVVREYDSKGTVVWSYKLDLNGRPFVDGHEGHGTNVFDAIRLKNGDTMIAGGNNNRVLEVSKEGTIVWSIDQDELPGIHLQWVTTLEMLPNGHLVIGNTHAGPNNPQLIEVTRDKKVVWTFHDLDHFGNDVAAAEILDVKGPVIR